MNKQNASQRKNIEMDFADFDIFIIVKLEKKKVAFRESKVQKMECIKANYSKSSCQ